MNKMLFKLKLYFKKCKIGSKVIFENNRAIQIGSDVHIGDYSVISGFLDGQLKIDNNVHISRYCKIATCGGDLIIGKNVSIGDRTIITAQGGVTIDDDVLMADRISIIANQHKYEDINLPIAHQGQISKPIHIKSGTWIGINATILQDVTIGKNCVIGANSVVTKDIPDYCVVAGIPARIIKKYDPNTQKWITVH